MTETRWLNEQEQRMWRGSQRMWRNLDRSLERDLIDRAGLSTADFSVLVPLSEAPEHRLRARDWVAPSTGTAAACHTRSGAWSSASC